MPVEIQDFDGFKHVLVTHGHFDHIVTLPQICRRNPEMRVYCTETPFNTLRKRGVNADQLVLVEYGQQFDLGAFHVRVHHAKHGQLPMDLAHALGVLSRPPRRNIPGLLASLRTFPENDETVMWEVRAEGKTVLVMGSLNLREEVEYPQGADLLLLPYNGWSDNYPPAVSVLERLRPKRVLLHHFDVTFPPVSSPVDTSPILAAFPQLVAEMDLQGECML